MKSFETTFGAKQKIRELLCRTTAKYYNVNTPIEILTLTSNEMLDYELFRTKFPQAHITCVERDTHTHKSLRCAGIRALKGTTTQHFRERSQMEEPYTLIFLDYYGHISSSVITDIDLLVHGNSNTPFLLPRDKPAIVGITLSKKMRSKRHLHLFNTIVTKQDEIVEYNAINTQALLLSRFDSKFEATALPTSLMEYKASEQSYPMFFFCFVVQRY